MNSLHSLLQMLPPLCHRLVLIGLSALLPSGLLLLLGQAAGRALRSYGAALERYLYQATLLCPLACFLLTFALAGRGLSLFHLTLPPAQTLSLPAPLPVSSSFTDLSSNPEPQSETYFSQAPIAERPSEAAANHNLHIEVPPVIPVTGTTALDAFPASDHRLFLPEKFALQTSPMGWLSVVLVGIWLGGTVSLLTWLLVC